MTLEFGISLSLQAHAGAGETSAQVYGEALELAAEASRLGLDSIWVSEHHGEADGYCPSPIVAGAALAVAAPGCRIGQAIAIAPLYGHPMRLAEDLSVLDNLSGGRAEIGLGQGYRPEEFTAIGADYRRRTRAFEEALDVLGLAWTGAAFDYAGDIYQSASARLCPAPLRPGPLPLWIGAAAPVSRARAVRHGGGLVISPLVEDQHAARQFHDFDQEAAQQGRAALPHAILREVFFGGSVEDELKRHEATIDLVYRQQYAPERTGLTWRDPKTGQRRAMTRDDPDYLSPDFVEGRWLIGPPDRIVDDIVAGQASMKLDRLVWQPKLPGTSLRDAVESLEIMARDVIAPVRAQLSAREARR